MELSAISRIEIPADDSGIRAGQIVKDDDGELFVVLEGGGLVPLRNMNGSVLTVDDLRRAPRCLARGVSTPVTAINVNVVLSSTLDW
jgi:hypothetical protein